MPSQEQNVLSAIPKGWQLYFDHTKAEVKIGTKLPFLHEGLQRLIGGTCYAHIHIFVPKAAQPSDHLHLQRL